jgi:hypothetical protein
MENGVTERAPAREGEIAPDAASDGSRGTGLRLREFRAAIGRTPPLLLLVSALGLVAAVLMIATEFSTIASVELPGGSCATELELADPEQQDRCELSGFERHGGALILLGLICGAMAIGAGVGGSRPAAAALVTIGVVVLAIGLFLDLPETDETGAIGPNFEGASGSAGTGLYLELIAGGLALGAGLLRLMGREPSSSRRADRPASSPPSA